MLLVSVGGCRTRPCRSRNVDAKGLVKRSCRTTCLAENHVEEAEAASGRPHIPALRGGGFSTSAAFECKYLVKTHKAWNQSSVFRPSARKGNFTFFSMQNLIIYFKIIPMFQILSFLQDLLFPIKYDDEFYRWLLQPNFYSLLVVGPTGEIVAAATARKKRPRLDWSRCASY
jgi:hypothetical protein